MPQVCKIIMSNSPAFPVSLTCGFANPSRYPTLYHFLVRILAPTEVRPSSSSLSLYVLRWGSGANRRTTSKSRSPRGMLTMNPIFFNPMLKSSCKLNWQRQSYDTQYIIRKCVQYVGPLPNREMILDTRDHWIPHDKLYEGKRGRVRNGRYRVGDKVILDSYLASAT